MGLWVAPGPMSHLRAGETDPGRGGDLLKVRLLFGVEVRETQGSAGGQVGGSWQQARLRCQPRSWEESDLLGAGARTKTLQLGTPSLGWSPPSICIPF